MMKKVFLFGSSGHALVVQDALQSQGLEVAGYFDEKPSVQLNGVPWCGSERDTDVKTAIGDGAVFPAIGSNAIREKLVGLAIAQQLELQTAIHARAIVAPSAIVGAGTLVGPGSVINPMARIGRGCIINTSAVVEHECMIGDFAHIAPGAVLAGNVKVGLRSFVGANAVVKQGIEIGDDAVVGAGAVVLTSIPDGETWGGNPAKKIK